MVLTQGILKVLVVGSDEDLSQWFLTTVRREKQPWRVRFCSPLRLNAPEYQLNEQDIIIVLWEQIPRASLPEILDRVSPRTRAAEGTLLEIESAGGEEKLRRTLVLGRSLLREDAVFVGELGVRAVFPLPGKRSQWDGVGPQLLEKIRKMHETELSFASQPEERAVQRFLGLLNGWSKLSDEVKMESAETLLRVLGDTSRYAELIARRCLKEDDVQGAEQWLLRAISKNPNYLRAMQLLADVYFGMGRFVDSLRLLQKLKENSPRNILRLTKIGKCYLAMGEFQKAEKTFTDALSIDEFSREAREELGKVKFVLGDYEGARKLLRDAENLKQLAQFLNAMGVKLVESRKFAESIDHYKRAQLVIPGNEQSHMLFFNISLAYAKWGKLNQALEYARLAVVREPQYAKAASLIQRILELRPQSAA